MGMEVKTVSNEFPLHYTVPCMESQYN